MKIGIVIPSYNQVQFLDQSLTSVISQRDYADLEIQVFDGGSNDGSVDVIQQVGHQLDYWQSCADGGQSSALRAAFERATGDVLGWVNSDDFLLPGALGTVSRWFEDHPTSVLAYGDAIWVDHRSDLIKAKIEIDFDWSIFAYGYCYLPQPSTFFRRDAYDAVGGIDAALQCSFDYDLWHRLVRLGPVGHIRTVLSGIRDHPDTKTNRLKSQFRLEHSLLRQRYLRDGPITYSIRHVYHRARRLAKRLQARAYLSDVGSIEIPRIP